MAIAFTSAATPSSITSGSTLTVTLPSHSTDDFLIIKAYCDYNSDTSFFSSIDNGWTQIAEHSVSGQDGQGAVYYKKATSGSESNPTITFGAGTQDAHAICCGFSGVDTIGTDVSAWTLEDPDTDASIAAPGITTDNDGDWLISVLDHDDDTDNAIVPSGMTMATSYAHTSKNSASFIAYQEIASAGATGTKTWTGLDGNDEAATMNFSLQVAAASSSIAPLTYHHYQRNLK